MSDKQAPMEEWPRELTLDDEAGPAAYITRAKADAIIFGALDRAGFPVANDVIAQELASPPRRRASRHGFRYVAAAALLAFCGVGSASAAAIWYFGIGSVTVVEPSKVVAPTPTPKRQRKHVPAAQPPAPAVPSVLPEVVVEAVATRPERRAPEDWLEEGNRLRAEKRWAKADEAYSRAFQSASKSQTAYVARVASAAVRLEHLSDAKGALALYRTALRQEPKGPLGEEILLGIAEAHRALGDVGAERTTLGRFLLDYPNSALAKQVRERLGE